LSGATRGDASGKRLPARGALAVVLVAGAAVAAIAFLWWKGTRDPRIAFFPRDGHAEWIVYPNPPEMGTRPVVELETVFSRDFDLARVTGRETLSVRFFRRGELSVNGSAVTLGPADGGGFKRTRSVAVSSILRAGKNAIVARVRSSSGPPALWLVLEGADSALRSDASFTASLAGGTPLPARLASTPMSEWSTKGAAGDPVERRLLSRAPRATEALARSWPSLLILAAISAAAVLGLPALVRARAGAVRLVPAAAALAWAALFFHNRALLTGVGFDCRGHTDYVQYVLDRGALPLADEGWEMFQPPLYYAIAAGVLRLLGLEQVGDPAAVAAIRWIGCISGVLQIVFVFASLRILFPGSPRRAIAGVLAAAFLPMQLYLCQYVTNESFSAMLVSASVYLALRILSRDDRSFRSHLLLGAVLGLALLGKFSALLALAAVLAVLAGRLVLRGVRDPLVFARTVGAAAGACVLVSGWHFARVAMRFGNPFIGNWDPATGFSWWQDPGYRVFEDYVRFGLSLAMPVFSSPHSVPDGIYSTLWGDGMLGGRTLHGPWPPWNLDLMTAGYVLALVPSGALVAGFLAAVVRLAREPRAEWFLLLGLLFLTAFGVILMTLVVPSHAQAKAFYGAATLVPISAVAALGIDLLAGRSRTLSAAVLALLACWGLNAYVSFWSPGGASSAEPPEMPADVDARAFHERALAAYAEGRPDEAREEALRAVALDPDLLGAHALLATLWLDRGDAPRAIAAAREAVRVKPAEPALQVLLGQLLDGSGEREEAVERFETALAIEPSHEEALASRAEALAALGRWAEAVASLRQAAEERALEPSTALVLASLLVDRPVESLRDAALAVGAAEAAARGLPEDHPRALDVLASAYALAGRFDDAARAIERLIPRLRGEGDAAALRAAEERLERYRGGGR